MFDGYVTGRKAGQIVFSFSERNVINRNPLRGQTVEGHTTREDSFWFGCVAWMKQIGFDKQAERISVAGTAQ